MYAPIIIPTLNRVEHLKRCVESLKKNKYATETELYISVDYPPAEKYMEGYEAIKDYLKELGDADFKKVNVAYQKTNLGVHRNPIFLIEWIKHKYDRFIFTEDDNTFSNNFLEYINKGLDIFEHDDRIMCICGYKHDAELNYGDANVALVDVYHAWGVGCWTNKYDLADRWISRENYELVLKNYSICKGLYENRKRDFHSLVEAILVNPKDYSNVYCDGDKLATIDYTISLYMHVNHKYAVLPDESKVQNYGFDGSGEHCGDGNVSRLVNFNLDNRDYFEYKYVGKLKVYENNQYFYETDYVKKARTSKFYRRIILVFGKNIARKIYNLVYILNKKIGR